MTSPPDDAASSAARPGPPAPPGDQPTTPGTRPADPTPDAGNPPELEWWQQPGMPWKHKPTRSDIACLTWMSVSGLIALALLPFRAWMLAQSPIFLLAVLGSRTGAAATGALAAVGRTHDWWWALLAGSLMSIKFDWIFWWAGKLWGRGMIEVWAGQSKRAARNYARAETWAHKLGWLGIFVAYVPIPLPLMQVIFVLTGATGMKLRNFLMLDFLASLVWLAGYMYLGYEIGEPVVEVLKQYAKYANYVAIALVVFVIGSMILRSGKNKPVKAA